MKLAIILTAVGIITFSTNKSYGQSDKDQMLDSVKSYFNPAQKNYYDGNYDSSIAFYDKASKRLDNYKSKFGKDDEYYKLHSLIFAALGNSYYKKNDFNRSDDYYQKGLKEQLNRKHPINLNNFYYGLGRNYGAKGHLGFAKGYMEKALQVIDTTNTIDLVNKGTYLIELSEVCGNFNDSINQYKNLKKSIILNRKLITLDADKKGPYYVAVRGLITASNKMFKLLMSKGDFELAKKISLESLSYYEDHPQKEQYYFTFDNLMTLYLNTGDFLEAKKYMEKAININSFPPYSIFANTTKAKYYAGTNEYLKSNEIYYEIISKIKKERIFTEKLSELLECSAKNYIAVEEYRKALHCYEEAMALLSLARSDKFTLTPEEADVYHGAIYCCLRLADYTKAYNYMLTYKSYNLNSLLVALNKEAYSSWSEKIKNDEIEKKITSLNLSKKSPEEKETELRLLISEFNDNMSNISLAYKPVELKDIFEIIKPNEILLDFFAVREMVFCFVIEKDGITAHELGFKFDLDKLINSFQTDFINPSQNYFYQGALRFGRIAEEKFPVVSNNLYKFLMENISKRTVFKDKKLIILPSGDLSKIPFELLITDNRQKPYSAYDYLFLTTEINYYPSAITFHLLRHLKNENEAFKYTFLGVGDPLFAGHPAMKNYKLNAKGNYMPVSKTMAASNASKIEIAEIGKIFPASSELLLERENATEFKFKSSNPGNYKYIHLSTHGFVNTDIPELSSLKLTEDKDIRDDGSLTALELLPLKLNTELIVLSACESGLGKIDEREGMTGFSNYLLMAGAKSTILSLWPVADMPTSVFFTNFYKNLIKESKDKLEALHKVRQAFLKDTEYANPFLWAPFILYGNR